MHNLWSAIDALKCWKLKSIFKYSTEWLSFHHSWCNYSIVTVLLLCHCTSIYFIRQDAQHNVREAGKSREGQKASPLPPSNDRDPLQRLAESESATLAFEWTHGNRHRIVTIQYGERCRHIRCTYIIQLGWNFHILSLYSTCSNSSVNDFKDEKLKVNFVLTADEDDPELSPLCITRTLHLTLTFLCLTPNWVQMRTMMLR